MSRVTSSHRWWPRFRPELPSNTSAWIDFLWVAIDSRNVGELEVAQAILRLPPDEQGWPPGCIEIPAASPKERPFEPTEYDGNWTVVEPDPTPREGTLVAPEGKSLRGAYARRARG